MHVYKKCIHFFFLPWLVVFVSAHCLAETPRLLKHAGGDIKESFAGWPVLVLAGGTVAGAVSYHYWDDEVKDYFSTNQVSEKMDATLNVVGSPYVLSAVGLIGYSVGLYSDNLQFKRTTETLAEALVFNAIMTQGLKMAFGRQRPNGNNYSFPSGHTSTSFAFATVLQSMLGNTYGLPAYGLSALIGFSRIDGNYHYLSDVLFGAALGSFIGWGTSNFHKKENTNLLISPMFDQTRGIMVVYKF